MTKKIVAEAFREVDIGTRQRGGRRTGSVANSRYQNTGGSGLLTADSPNGAERYRLDHQPNTHRHDVRHERAARNRETTLAVASRVSPSAAT